MGKFLSKFKGIKPPEKKESFNRERFHNPRMEVNDLYDGADGEDYPADIDNYDNYDMAVSPAQKPESFHHFILENQYKDLERSIRGVKDVWDKETNSYKTKRKDRHCFTDEEAEDILRTAQSHLATDIKLGFINKDVFGEYMQTLYEEVSFLFRSIAEYRYGRYGSYENQYKMKLQNLKIFLELWTRIQANYSRSIQGKENQMTHDSVRGQESLQSNETENENNRGYF